MWEREEEEAAAAVGDGGSEEASSSTAGEADCDPMTLLSNPPHDMTLRGGDVDEERNEEARQQSAQQLQEGEEDEQQSGGDAFGQAGVGALTTLRRWHGRGTLQRGGERKRGAARLCRGGWEAARWNGLPSAKTATCTAALTRTAARGISTVSERHCRRH